ncbi:hypothetical protein B0H17DRAFT_1104405 [Mycena rosella]|uniref:Uncharacterized protein n=1 Tax=Mycena rosella TaxID=1033263 RepID=A0AAD7FYU4_MYCRO|nr:hypothetical protein B0H17DRAFT_1104405 [Mycena rosella]
MLGQSEIARYLEQCDGVFVAIEEVLSAYIVWKYLKGATSERVLVKLRYLTIYLRVTGRSHIVAAGADAFKALTMEVSLGGGRRVGLLPAMTLPGKAAWNELRRAAHSRAVSLATDSVYGGPGPVRALYSILKVYLFLVRLGQILTPAPAPGYVSEREILTTLPEYASRDYGSRLGLVV